MCIRDRGIISADVAAEVLRSSDDAPKAFISTTSSSFDHIEYEKIDDKDLKIAYLAQKKDDEF